MRTLHLDMPAGAAGDMVLAALIACGADPERIAAGLAGLGAGPIALRPEAVTVGGLTALRVAVDAPQEAGWQPLPFIALRPGSAAPPAPAEPPHGPHRPWRAIRDLLAAATLEERVRSRAQAVFRLLAEAEAAVHGCPVDDICFHEVGSLDAIADVVGCCLALEQLGVERVVAGALRPGSGTVRCAHGLMPVPVPAVAEMLRRPAPRTGLAPPWLPEATATGELTTPTGAALVCALADAFVGQGPALPPQRLLATGYGAGTKRIPGLVNVLRASLSEDQPAAAGRDTVVELACQVDDMTGEDLGTLIADLLAAGALDALAAPVVMKKGRPGHALTVIARPPDRAPLTALLLRGSTSLGVRWREMERSVLPRRTITVSVEGHAIALKLATLPDGGERAKPEHDTVVAAARALGWPPERVRRAALQAWGG
jgi:uncharacterized protein (TIGR00299 family) protein